MLAATLATTVKGELLRPVNYNHSSTVWAPSSVGVLSHLEEEALATTVF